MIHSLDKVQSAGPEHNWEKFYKLKKGDVFVEVGAFWGRYGMLASAAGCSKVILIEPSPDNVATINNVIQKGGIKNAVVVNKAVAAKKDMVNFIIRGNPAQHRVGICSDPEYVIYVPGDRFDDIMDELNVDHIDLLASDCEGCEIELITTAEKWLSSGRIKNVAIGTYHESNNHYIVSGTLMKHGFTDLVLADGITYGHVAH